MSIGKGQPTADLSASPSAAASVADSSTTSRPPPSSGTRITMPRPSLVTSSGPSPVRGFIAAILDPLPASGPRDLTEAYGTGAPVPGGTGQPHPCRSVPLLSRVPAPRGNDQPSIAACRASGEPGTRMPGRHSSAPPGTPRCSPAFAPAARAAGPAQIRAAASSSSWAQMICSATSTRSNSGLRTYTPSGDLQETVPP